VNINSPFPYEVDALIDALDEIYPDRAPNLDDPDRVIWVKAGQSSVVSFLKAWRKASLETHPYVSREKAPHLDGGRSGEASSGLHQPVLRRSRRGRGGRPSGS